MTTPDDGSKDPGEITLQVYRLLAGLDAGDRKKVLVAVSALLGEHAASVSTGVATSRVPSPTKELILGPDAPTDPASFFSAKDPQTKVEELAVAARYRELATNEDVHDKDNLREIVRAARRNFDDRNFHRDISNARIAGLFNRGKQLTLSFYGQNYVDALPNRDAVKALRRPKGPRRRPGAMRDEARKNESAE